MVAVWKARLVGGYNRVATWIHFHRSRALVGTVGLFLVIALGLIGWALLFPSPNVSPDFDPFNSVEEYEAFMTEHPLMSAQAPEGASFTIHGQVTADRRAEYTVELFAPALKPNNPESMNRYIAALKKSQEEAKAWIKTTGEPSEGLYIAWTPNPDVLGSTQERHPIPQKKPGAKTTAPTPTPTSSAKPTPTPAFPH